MLCVRKDNTLLGALKTNQKDDPGTGSLKLVLFLFTNLPSKCFFRSKQEERLGWERSVLYVQALLVFSR